MAGRLTADAYLLGETMSGPAGVMALVLAELVAGVVVFAWLTPLWAEVKHGFFKVTGVTVAALAASTWLSISAGLEAGSEPGRLAMWCAAAITIVSLVGVVLLFARIDRAAWAAGMLTIPISVLMLGALAGTATAGWPLAFFQLLAGAAFLGSVLVALLLGHWYLTDRKLTRVPINRAVVFLLVGVVLEAVAIILGGFGPAPAGTAFNPLLIGTAPWIAMGMVVVTGLVGVLARATLKGDRSSAVQAATGFFYLAVLTSLTGELAAKVGFFS